MSPDWFFGLRKPNSDSDFADSKPTEQIQDSIFRYRLGKTHERDADANPKPFCDNALGR